MDPARQILLTGWSPDLSRYTRGQGVMRVAGSAAKVRAYGYNSASGGTLRALEGTLYRLMVDGQPVAETRPTGSALDFVVDATRLTPGYHFADVVADPPTGESSVPYWLLVPGAGATYVPVTTGSYTLAMHPGPVQWVRAPYTYAPTPRPLVPRAATPFATAIPRSEMHCTQLVPLRWGDTYRVCRTEEGMLTSAATQPYHWSDLVARMPRVPLLDGPRGVGTVCMATHVQFGREMPSDQGGTTVYFCDPWRVGKVTADGTVTTLAGYRHRGIATHWQSPPDLELVGDWSAVPAERRGFHELWGMAWDTRTVQRGAGPAQPNPPRLDEPPHDGSPVLFVADSQMNRICRVEFDGKTHGPGKVSEFVTNLRDPWDVVCIDGVIYVSERQSHRIAAYDATTGAYLRTVVQGADLAIIDRNREVVRQAPLATIQAAACVAPEGLYHLDGWIYYGSKAQAQIRRVSIATGTVEVVTGIAQDDNTKFAKIAISDGTTGPRGTTFVAEWSNADMGLPETRTPDRQRWEWNDNAPSRGGAGQWSQFVYPTAVGCAAGRIVVGGANEGLLLITRKTADEAPPSVAVTRGATEFMARGLHLLHGMAGFGYYGLPLPWGLSADIDSFLTYQGHTP